MTIFPLRYYELRAVPVRIVKCRSSLLDQLAPLLKGEFIYAQLSACWNGGFRDVGCCYAVFRGRERASGLQ